MLAILTRCRASMPGLTEQMAGDIEREIRERFGGRRIYVAGRKKHMNTAQRSRAYEDAVSNAPLDEVLERNGVSRATLYRLLKRG